MRVFFSVLPVVLLALCSVAQQPQRGVAREADTAVGGDGSYYALVIGINRYQHEPVLQTAVSDAKAIDAILHDRYGFKTKVLLDAQATRTNILNAFGQYRRALGENDKLLIYYAGHGARDGDKAYWLPVDSDPDSAANWIIADDITAGIRVIPAKHVLIVSDSCYSGALGRSVGANALPADHDAAILRMLSSRSRILISSGRDEPVADTGSAGHSVFAAALLTGLTQMDERSFTAMSLFDRYVREPVIGRSEQVPLYQIIQNSGHDGGDFVFFSGTPASTEVTTTPKVPNIDTSRIVAPPTDQLAPVVLPRPSFRYSSSAPKPAAPSTVRLQEVSHKPNQITDDDKWFSENKLSLPEFEVPNPFRSITGNVPSTVAPTYSQNMLVRLIRNGDYWVAAYGPNFSGSRYLMGYSASTQKPLWTFDFENYRTPPEYVEADRSYVDEYVQWASVQDDVLYVSNSHSTYAKSSKGWNAYLNAIDLRSKQLLWRSKPLTSNSGNSAIYKDAIITGYGFTAETHFLYVLDRRDGSVVQTIPVVKSPEYILIKGGLVYVRTYNTDYIFKIVE